MQKNFSLAVVVVVFSTMLFSASPAFAYLDPGTGSMVLQALIGGIIGGLIAMKLYWHKVKAFFSGAKSKTGKTSD